MQVAVAGVALSVMTLAFGIAVYGQPAPSSEARRLYLSQCSKCHGVNGTPKPIAKKAPRFTDPGWTTPMERILETIVKGKGEDMPKFGKKLSAEQIRTVAEFVRQFKND